VREVQFPLALRGYDRGAVDAHLAEIAQLVAELEATQLRENVVQRALDEVGEQTSGILQHAHETAEEITARSRAQAEGRIQRAERDAETIRRSAEKYGEQVAADMRRLTEERRRLIEELRQFAEDVLATADDALDRLPELLPPEAKPEPAAQPEPQEAAEPTQRLPRPAPEPSPPPAPERPATERVPDDGIAEGILRVERRPRKPDAGASG
jgi:cell division initiation protein